MHRKITGLLAILLLGCAWLTAQVQTGNITGTVRDATGAVVPNATVTVVSLGTQARRTVQSSSTGTYTVTGLQPGQYEVTVTSGNFAPFKQEVNVAVGGNSALDVSLGVSASATVEVVAQNASIEVNTQTQELSQIISSATVTIAKSHAKSL